VLIRRLVLLLSVALAGGGIGERGSSPASQHPTAPDARTAPGLVAADHDHSGAVLRSSGRLLTVGWQVGPATSPWPRSGGAEPVDVPATAFASTALISEVVARGVEAAHRAYARPMARANSGFVSSPSTAPPPFRFV
jgi:hypothetical protein